MSVYDVSTPTEYGLVQKYIEDILDIWVDVKVLKYLVQADWQERKWTDLKILKLQVESSRSNDA